MLQKKLKKAFTITELVIVIAVIAILAAVLIPTFLYVVDKANESADVQGARDMNTALSAGAVDGAPESVGAVVDILLESGFSEEFATYGSNNSLKWDKTRNLVVVYDTKALEIVFPEYTSAQASAAELYNLSISSSVDKNDLSAAFSGGDGTKDAPYLIATVKSMQNLRTIVANGWSSAETYYRLDRSLTLNQFDPIGDVNYTTTPETGSATIQGYRPFTGVFDGDGNTIALNKQSGTDYDYALFLAVQSATISDLNVDADIDVSNYDMATAAGVASVVDGNVTFENITVTGTIKGNKWAGGVVGWYAKNESGGEGAEVIFKNCVNRADISVCYASSGFAGIGGICAQATGGKAYDKVTFENCRNEGTLRHTVGQGVTCQAYSIIGHIVGQRAGATSTENDSTMVFNNCTYDETKVIYGYKKTDGGYCFEGVDQTTNANTYKGSPNPNKLLIGGALSKTVVIDGTTYTEKYSGFENGGSSDDGSVSGTETL